MSVITKEQVARKPFIDKKNYPYGFARSGDFSINESKLLADQRLPLASSGTPCISYVRRCDGPSVFLPR